MWKAKGLLRGSMVHWLASRILCIQGFPGSNPGRSLLGVINLNFFRYKLNIENKWAVTGIRTSLRWWYIIIFLKQHKLLKCMVYGVWMVEHLLILLAVRLRQSDFKLLSTATSTYLQLTAISILSRKTPFYNVENMAVIWCSPFCFKMVGRYSQSFSQYVYWNKASLGYDR